MNTARNQSLHAVNSNDIAQSILGKIMTYRRVPETFTICAGIDCHGCSSHHLAKISQSIANNEVIKFVLPAFPAKSPNPNKVISHKPDYAEIHSLKFLNSLCEMIKEIYAPGMSVLLCSDGRVFSDVIGIKECHVSQYQNEIQQIISTHKLQNLELFNLDDVYTELCFRQMRDELMKTYSETEAFVHHKIKRGAMDNAEPHEIEANRMYKGITRFLFEDSKTPSETRSNTALQKDAKRKAIDVIRRSNAWSNLIEDYFPEAVRLSIHPQTCGAKKLGIKLISNESWMTPWHGVALESATGYTLVKKSVAEAMGASLVYDASGEASHYRISQKD